MKHRQVIDDNHMSWAKQCREVLDGYLEAHNAHGEFQDIGTSQTLTHHQKKMDRMLAVLFHPGLLEAAVRHADSEEYADD